MMEGFFKDRYRITIQTIECDNEFLRSLKLMQHEKLYHIRWESSAAYTSAQNGAAERSRGVIKNIARTLRATAKFPPFLAKECLSAAIYLDARTPKHSLAWKTHHDRFYTYLAFRSGVPVENRMPKQQHLKAYGCKAYVMTKAAMKNTQRLQKLKPQAWVGFLAGDTSTNIYRIWNPVSGEVHAVRDVGFDETRFFNGNLDSLRDTLWLWTRRHTYTGYKQLPSLPNASQWSRKTNLPHRQPRSKTPT
jgi:hypothetical protein